MNRHLEAYYIGQIKLINCRLNEIESQVCGAKKHRLDEIDARLDRLEGHNDPDCPFCNEPANDIRDIVFGYVNQLVDHKIDEAKLGPRINDIIQECEFLAAEIDEGRFDIQEIK